MSLLNGNGTDPNKILPITYPWAREHYRAGVANNWTPEEIPMQQDVEQWKSSSILSKEERRLILHNLGFFSTAESLTANNLVLAVYRHIVNPECRQYLLRQAYEEAVHTDTFIYCCDTLGLNPDDVYNMYQENPIIANKDNFVTNLTRSIFKPAFSVVSDESTRELLRDLIGFYVIMEGIFFYAGFSMMLALKRMKKMTGIGQQFEYIMRDESLHLAFGMDLINTIREENPSIWTQEFESEVRGLILQSVELEFEYIDDALPRPILGIDPGGCKQYVRYIADRRLALLKMEKEWNVESPFPWMSQSTDLQKEKNFFETRVTEYQTAGSLEW